MWKRLPSGIFIVVRRRPDVMRMFMRMNTKYELIERCVGRTKRDESELCERQNVVKHNWCLLIAPTGCTFNYTKSLIFTLLCDVVHCMCFFLLPVVLFLVPQHFEPFRAQILTQQVAVEMTNSTWPIWHGSSNWNRHLIVDWIVKVQAISIWSTLIEQH